MELVVVTGIITIVSALMLASNTRFGGVILLRNLAYDIAISVRQAQVFGISVARFGAGTFSAGYGVSFTLADPTHYTLFADAVEENGLYDTGEEVIPPSPMTIGQGYRIADLCVTDVLDVESCGYERMDVFFKRPEPDAYMSVNGTPLSFDADGRVTSTNIPLRGRILVQSPRGECMSVVIEITGQIAVTSALPNATVAVCNQH